MVRTLVNLSRIRANARGIRERTGVDLIGVVKANAYGLGAVAIADAINEYVSCWYVFEAAEVVRYRLYDITGKPTLCAITDESHPITTLRQHRVRPGVWTLEGVERFASLDPILSVDTGMQRFACPPDRLDALLKAYTFREAFTHASRAEQAHELADRLGGRGMKLHAAGTALLDDPTCRLDAVRPGLALYADAVRVILPLVEARESRGPIGYTRFTTRHHGVVLQGYSDGMRPGPCLINGRRQEIIEVGMQSAFVTLDPADRVGDEVVLLGDELTLAAAAAAYKSSPHETLHRLASLGQHIYTR